MDIKPSEFEPPFEGERRRQLVRDLASLVPQLGAESTTAPRVFVLHGEPGCGKSRIVRELYEVLASTRPEAGPRYWPALPPVTREASGIDRWRNRKVLGPVDLHDPHFREPGAIPQFMWVHSCVVSSQGSGLTTVRGDLREQLNAHAGDLSQALMGRRNKARVAARIGIAPLLGLAVRVFGSGLNDNFAGLPVDEVLLGVPDVAAGVAEGLQHAAHMSERIRRGGAAYEGPRAALAAVTELTNGGEVQMPTILVLEDIHLMDVDVRDFLTLLCALQDTPAFAGWPLLVIGTAQDIAAPGPVFRQWIAESADSRVDFIKVEDLEPAAVNRIVMHYAPHTPADSPAIAALAQHTGNPMVLMAMLDDARFLTIEDGFLQTPARWDRIPRDLRGLYNSYWEALPNDTQDALMSAVLALPDEALDSPTAWPFLADVVQRSSPPAADGTIADYGEGAFGEARATGWLRGLAEVDALDVLTSWLMAQVINGSVDAVDRDQQRAFQDRIRHHLRHRLAGFLLDPANVDDFDQLRSPGLLEVAAARWLYSLRVAEASTGDSSISRTVDAWAAFVVAGAEAEVGSYLSALRTFDPAVNIDAMRGGGVLSHRLCNTLLRVADWFDRAGMPARAATLAEQVRQDAERASGTGNLGSPCSIRAEAAALTYAAHQAELIVDASDLERSIDRVGTVLAYAIESGAVYVGGLYATRMKLLGALSDLTEGSSRRGLLDAAERDYIAWAAQQEWNAPQTVDEERQAINEIVEVARHHERIAAFNMGRGFATVPERLRQAVRLLEDVLLRQEALPAPIEDQLRTRNELIRIRREWTGDFGAERIQMHALDRDASEYLPEDSLTRLRIRSNYINVLAGTGQGPTLAKARNLCAQLVDDYAAHHPEHPDCADAQETLGMLKRLTDG